MRTITLKLPGSRPCFTRWSSHDKDNHAKDDKVLPESDGLWIFDIAKLWVQHNVTRKNENIAEKIVMLQRFNLMLKIVITPLS